MSLAPSHISNDLESSSDPTKQRLRLWLRMLRATKMVETEIRENLKETFDTTLPRFDVLAALYNNATSNEESAITMTELSRKLKVSNGNVTGIIDRLVNDASVVRIQSPKDRRSNRVMVTPKGRTEFESMAVAHEGWINDLLGDTTDNNINEMISLVDQMNKNVMEKTK